MLLAAFGIVVPVVFDYIISGLIVLLGGYAISRLLREIAKFFVGENFIPKIIRDIIIITAQTTLAAICENIKNLDPEKQTEAVRLAAQAVYQGLPYVILIPIKGRIITVPFKAIVSEIAFVTFVIGLYNQIDYVYDELLINLQEEYAWWLAIGKPVEEIIPRG